MESPENAGKVKLGAGNFFAIDRRAWATVCQLAVNAAISYLVLGRGTGGDNRTTSWSVNAIEQKTSISRPRAKAALLALESAGPIAVPGRGKHPRYYLRPAHEIPGCEDGPVIMSVQERRVYELVSQSPGRVPKVGRYNDRWGSGRPCEVAEGLVAKGLLVRTGTQSFKVREIDLAKAAEPDWIWLPNTLVDGAAGETPPIEILRQAQNITAIRILGDLYHAHALATDGGAEWREGKGIRQSYLREKVGEWGSYVIWSFISEDLATWHSAPIRAAHARSDAKASRDTFWDGWSVLRDAGLVQMVAHLVDADTADGEVLHPLPSIAGEEGERAITAAAYEAARAMIADWQHDGAMQSQATIVPVRKHMANVQLVGVARLRYRPHTKATAAWFSHAEQWEKWALCYQAIEAEAKGFPALAISR